MGSPPGGSSVGPNEALGERRFRDEERTGDLGRRQAAERPERQRDPGVERQGRVAAREDEAQAIVVEPALRAEVHRGYLRGRQFPLEHRELLGLPPIAPNPVQGPIARRRRQPGCGRGGDAVPWPGLERRRKGIRQGFLGGIEVPAQEADQGRQDAAVSLPIGPLDGRVGLGTGTRTGRRPVLGRGLRLGHPANSGTGIPMIGLTSIDPPRAPGQRQPPREPRPGCRTR